MLFRKPKYAFITLVVLCCIVVGCGNKTKKSANAIEGTTKPNIVLIVAVDQGWGDISHSGNTNLQTNNIDAIAENGVSFESFFVQPVCSPTRAELLTGRYYSRMGVFDTSAGGERMDLGETTVAEIFKGSGYRTAIYGKWHNGTQPPYHPNARGFDDFYGFASGHWGNYFSPMLEHNGAIVKGNGFLVDDLTDHALDFIEQNQDKPFFLYLPYNTPHSPMQVPDEYWDAIKNDTVIMKHQAIGAEDEAFTKAALAMVSNIDYNVGRVQQKLEELNLTDNTIIIYMSDNGPNSWRWNGGLRGIKGDVDEGGVKTVFNMQWADSIKKGSRVSEIAGSIDLLPTLTALAGLETKTSNKIDGKNLMPLIFNGSEKWEDRILYNTWNGKTSLRTQHYRLDDADRLYDMDEDIGQKINISSEQPQIRDSLIAAKQRWLAEVKPPTRDDRPFTVGDPNFNFTQLPVRDAIAHGAIKRSNKWPNCSFFENWTSTEDSITWDIEVLQKGKFQAVLYYTCSEENVGSTLQLGHLGNQVSKIIEVANNPPLKGMEDDRVPRTESYVKDFKPLKLGIIELKKGRGQLTLQALNVKGKEVADVRLLMLNRIQ